MTLTIPRLAHLGKTLLACGLCCTLGALPCEAARAAAPRVDVVYAHASDRSLAFDFYYPEPPQKAPAPLLIYIHGGAWRAGDKADLPIREFTRRGYAIASVNYRLSTTAAFPAQIHDIKAAVRYLRAHAADHEVDPERFALVGSSAGGHLAALAGVSQGVAELEGTLGDFPNTSSRVQAIVSYYGAANLQSILDQSTEFGRGVRVPALQLLLGGQPTDNPRLARLASPVAHVDELDPPLLLLHGDADPQMPPRQSEEFARAYESAKAPVELIILTGGKHGGGEFYDLNRSARVDAFLRRAFTASSKRDR